MKLKIVLLLKHTNTCINVYIQAMLLLYYTPYRSGILGTIVVILLGMSCQPIGSDKSINKESLIPIPVAVRSLPGSFHMTTSTTIYTNSDTKAMKKTAAYLAALLRPPTGFELPVKKLTETPSKGHIYLKLSKNKETHPEGYRMTIKEERLELEASTPEGIFRGIQTLRQLLPPTIESKKQQLSSWKIAAGIIEDYPQYSYRGVMLDVSRHFFDVADVKRCIDLMAAYKLNILHLHLSDDQGWRIEIKSWPKLASYGGSNEVGGGKGGYYSQEAYKTIVAYAQERYITIIPEIDMPGHTNAVLASYPELNCNGIATKPYSGTAVGFSSLCMDKELTYHFIDDVIGELAAITPGPYIHIGGDESHATKVEDYISFINKVQDIVRSHGKIMIGWDEIQHATLHSESIAQFWASEDNAFEAVQKGAKLIISPASKAYMDMKYDSLTPLGLNWAGYIPVNTGYDWDPLKQVKGISKNHILGIEAPLWTETISTMKAMEYMIFPRMPGYAEIGWSPDSLRNWHTYSERLAAHYKRFQTMGICFYESENVPWRK